MTRHTFANRHGIFAGFVFASGLIFWKTWAATDHVFAAERIRISHSAYSSDRILPALR